MSGSFTSNPLMDALAKVNALPAGEAGSFTPDELHVLRAFAGRPADQLGERERLFHHRVTEVLRHHTSSEPTVLELERRKNAFLRTAIDKCMQGQALELSEEELRVLKSTASQLDTLTDPSASHLRLRGLVHEALVALAQAETQGVRGMEDFAPVIRTPKAAAQAVAPAGGQNADTFFEGGTRARIREFAEIPIETNARVIEHQGDVVIDGGVPDDVTLVVKEGGVTVHGQCAGNVLATRTVAVHGSISGAWTVSTDGDIRCDRVLGGANLVARFGTVYCQSMERPTRVYAGKAINVDGDARGGHLTAPEISIGGALRSAHVQILDQLRCGALEGEAREPATVTFRTVMSAQDYGVDLTDTQLTHTRELLRFRYRQAVGESMLAALQEDLRGLQLSRLCAFSGRTGIDVPGLRGLQTKVNYVSVAITIAEWLEQVLLESLEYTGDAQAACLKTGTDECQAAVKFLEREVSHLGDEFSRETKALLVSTCKHLTNLARRVHDAAGRPAESEEAAQALLSRLHELHGQKEHAAQSLGEIMHGVRDMIGEASVNVTDTEKLALLANNAANLAGHVANSVPMRALKAMAERHTNSIATYTHGAGEVKAERDRLERAVAGDPAVRVTEGRHADRFVRAARFGPHVALMSSPGMPTPTLGTPGEEGRGVRVDKELNGPMVYAADGLLLRRRTG